MQLDAANNEIKYDATYGTVARYVLILDGEITMAIQCDSADPNSVIKVIDPTGTHCLETLGRFKMAEIITENADGSPLGVEKRVDEKSVYAYVLPRMHVLLGRLLREAV